MQSVHSFGQTWLWLFGIRLEPIFDIDQNASKKNTRFKSGQK